jgi:hypothetical protein
VILHVDFSKPFPATSSLDSATSATSPNTTPSGAATPAPSTIVHTQRATLPDAPMAQAFDIDCTLDYEVRGPTDFVFQIHAHNGMGQYVLSESLVITPDLPRHL